MAAVCGLDCGQCEMRDSCAGCLETEGRPFKGAGQCPVYACCAEKGQGSCGQCGDCELKGRIIAEFNALGIPDMPEVTGLNTLAGSYVNLQYTLPGGQETKFWRDDRVYPGNQLEKLGGGRCYGLLADETHLMVCEYGEDGADPEIIIFKKRSVRL